MIQNEKVSVYYGTKEAYEFEKQYKRIDENALYFVEGIIYSGYELYSKDYKKVSEFPDIGQSNIIYINTVDSSVAIWNEDLNEWIYICRPLNDEIIDDSTTIASSAVVYKILEQSKEYTNSKCKETAETINLNIENSIMENNRNLFLGTSDKYNSIADICNILDGVLSIEETDRYTNEEIDNKFSTLETNIDWKEAVDTFDDILTTYPTPVDGWTVNVKDTDYTYRYNGEGWVVISANAIPNATSDVNGLLTKEDYIKINNIEEGAEVNQNAFSNIVVGSTTIVADSKTDSLTLAGNNITLTLDETNDKVTIGITKDNVVSALGYEPGTGSGDVVTYELSKSGSTITLTGSDGSTSSVTDSNDTYTLSSFGITATAAELNKLDGLTATTTELNYVDGVTSNIQTQLNDKADSSHTHNYAGSSSASGDANNALKLGGMSVSTAGTKDVWGTIPSIGGSDGVMEVGKYLDFHTTDGSTVDYDVRITANTTGLTLSGTTSGTFSGSLSGNASSSTKLATARNINGLSFDGTSNRINYGTCSTAAATAAKTVACTGFDLVTGAEITVKFTVTNTASSPTLNVNSTGAKAIYYRGSAISASYLAANRTYTFRYNGTQYDLVGDLDTNTDTDTKNTAGSTNTSSKIFLIGATSQAANPQTYSHDTAYVGTDGHLYSDGKQVVNISGSQSLTNKTYNGYTLAAACAKSVTDSTSASAITTGTSLVTERDVYYGLPTINNSHAYTSSSSIYAPTSGGTSNYTLHSSGTGTAPTWVNIGQIVSNSYVVTSTGSGVLTYLEASISVSAGIWIVHCSVRTNAAPERYRMQTINATLDNIANGAAEHLIMKSAGNGTYQTLEWLDIIDLSSAATLYPACMERPSADATYNYFKLDIRAIRIK